MPAAIGQHQGALDLGFHPFGDYVEVEAVGQAANGADDRQAVGVIRQGTHERLVDFQLIQRQLLQIGHGRVAGAEVVNREADAMGLEGGHAQHGARQVIEQQRFGQLQLQAVRVGASGRQQLQHLVDKVRLIQQARTQVDRQAQLLGGRLPGPCGQLLAGLAEHLQVQQLNQAGALGHLDKRRRREQAALRVLPAHQGLGTDQAVVFIHLRLQVHDELTRRQAAANVLLQLQARADGLLHRRVKKAQGILAGGFGLVHGQVRALHQLMAAGELVIKQQYADAGGTAQLQLTDQVRRLQGLQDLLADSLDLPGGILRVRLQVFQQHDKLIAAQAGHGVAAADRMAETLGHQAQQLVAGLVAMQVVDVLEVVQIEKHQRGKLALARAGGLRLLQTVEQQPAVGQPGQGIEKRQVLDLVFCGLVLRNIGQ